MLWLGWHYIDAARLEANPWVYIEDFYVAMCCCTINIRNKNI